MISIRSSADLARVFTGMLDPLLRSLLTARRDQWLDGADFDLGELVHVIIVQHGDTLAAVEAEAGVPIATNLVDGSRLGDPDFVTSFEWVERHAGWLEAVMILSDDGFGLALFVPDLIEIDPEITLLLRRCSAA
jgi:hypothetical protein